MGPITVGVPQSGYVGRLLSSSLPEASFVPVESPRPFLRGEAPGLDAVIWSAETGSAWTLIYPSFSVAVPRGLNVQVPGAYGLPMGQEALQIFVNRWLDLKLADGTTAALFDHWILGKDAVSHGRRWSIMRDVLGWGVGTSPEPPSDGRADAPATSDRQ
jgi:hypothetical protein